MSDVKKAYKVAIIVSEFNQLITSRLLDGAKQRLLTKGVTIDNMAIIKVPGAVEIPLVAKKLAKLAKYDAIITLGAVIRGETTHYDYVCEQVSHGVAKVMYEYELPVVFGVVTTENKAQALDRVGGAHGHKGIDAADCALEMIRVMEQVS
jgi:6,7-dimethyl-8-ribityllumazine synthase